MDKKKLIDTQGRPLTQSLFLEMGYRTEFAIYTLKDYDHTYKNGTVYPSLKKLYLEMQDPTEYDFANKYLLGWSHWKRLNANKELEPYFEQWREELEIKLRAQGVREMIDQAKSGTSFQASKWKAEKGWGEKVAGRPTKEAIKREAAIQAKINDEFKDDFERLDMRS